MPEALYRYRRRAYARNARPEIQFHVQDLRRTLSAKSQQRYLFDRRLWTPGVRALRGPQSLDRPHGAPRRLLEIPDRRQDDRALRSVSHLLHQPAARSIGRRGLPAPHSIQNAAAQSGRKRITEHFSELLRVEATPA